MQSCKLQFLNSRPEEWARQAAEAERRRREESEAAEAKDSGEAVEVEYVQDKLDMDPSDPMYRTFAKIFDAFKLKDDEEEAAERQRAEEKV